MNKQNDKNIVWQETLITPQDRERICRQKGVVIWFTGLSGSGKSTIARCLEKWLIEKKCMACLLDGDNIRHGLNRDLGFSIEARRENIRRIAEVARLFADCGVICLVALISPLIEMRKMAREIIGEGRFIEVAVMASLSTCEHRDPKRLYERARAGAIHDFTGISSPYEMPPAPTLVLNTEECTVDECADRVWTHLVNASVIVRKGVR
ncbi:MAG: adenylyl-sulfate kinase [Spartobacteria bacterium]|nr:adenylyl-sulfate kinase [Spartobacteria bacterium]